MRRLVDELQTCVIHVGGVHASTRPSSDGTFTLSGVPAGRQTVRAQTGFGAGRSRSRTVDVEVGQRVEVELDFSSARTVTVTVRRGQTPAPGVVMSLTTLAGGGLDGSRTGSDGRYRLE